MWAAFADSDTDSDTAEPREARHCAHLAVDAEMAEVSVPVVAVKTAPAALSVSVLPSAETAAATVASLFDDPLFAAMDRGEVMWGDTLLAERPPASSAVGWQPLALPVTPPPVEDDEEPLRELWANPQAPLRAKEADIWEQPFSANLEEYWSDTYDTRAMSDEDFHALMGWLYSKGWNVDSYNREGVRCWPDNASARRWDASAMAPEEERHIRWADEAPKKANGGCGHGHGHGFSRGGERVPKPKGAVTIPRFCREGHACSAGAACRYVHGDTIPRVNESCAFGAGCGASDSTGVKRSQCLRMHPGEVWTPELVIRRL